ncbi:hypothetical protein J4Q44_G00122200 [Coregonus suidteri]|uniref:Uncharacterized protein n=1 Tax=Coregonus suidteri TaxID=861788 RepID=A0AAN8QU90_9TELE
MPQAQLEPSLGFSTTTVERQGEDTDSLSPTLTSPYVQQESNRIREMQIELRELRQWTRLVCGRKEGDFKTWEAEAAVHWCWIDTTWTMVHVIKKRLHGIETSLMTCIQSMPSNITVAQNTCYTAVVHYLEQGSTLELSIPRKSAGFVLKPHTSFFGMFRI